MRIIASSGTKGGVGKSTFAILLAFKLSMDNKVVLCDCDVECPNDHLILDKRLRNPQPIYGEIPELDEEKCMKCGRCSQVCRENAIFWVKGKYPQFIYDLCTGCGACGAVCPAGAIKFRNEKVGEFFVNKIDDNFWLATGRSKAGVTETGPIVSEVKSRAIKLAREKRADFLIIDTAPGTHCSVIQALLDVDKVYAVTEPTPLGAHDLSLILELLQKMKIPFEIVLNKADVGNRREIEEIARRFNTRISIEIPYSEELIKAYCERDLRRMVGLLMNGGNEEWRR